MLRNTATSTNSNINNNRNRRITVILALCKLCILNFLTSSRWKMHITVRCVFDEEYQLLKKVCKCNKNSDQNYENYTHFEFMQKMYIWFFIYVFVEPWAGIRLGTWKKIIVVKLYIGDICVMVVCIKSTFLRLILNWHSLCKLSRDATKGSKNTKVIFCILEGNILGYAPYTKINPMLLHVKNFRTYI